ncbi:beta strand repeat-containing protein [Photobacterium leiognathi]|uniref:beta strand repeat-containing protein n=1 Tax=Photobacterium leiognathi TaxID=553611 RepID=UPI00273893E4|nr:hypothetical protein [Photobacterium leiognathi]
MATHKTATDWRSVLNYYKNHADFTTTEFSVTQRLDALNLSSIDLLIIMMPEDAFTTAEINAMEAHLTRGARIFFIGENGAYAPTENQHITDAIVALGGNIYVGTKVISTTKEHLRTNNHLNNHPLMAGVNKVHTSAFADLFIEDTISQAVVVGTHSDGVEYIAVADQALFNGRITVIADYNWMNGPTASTSSQNLYLENLDFLDNLAIYSNQFVNIVEDGGSPNEMFLAFKTLEQVILGREPATNLSTTDYADAGITGVDDNNLAYVNGELATGNYQTIAEIQAMVDGYAGYQNAVALVSGTDTTVTLMADQLNAISGVSGADPNYESLYVDALINEPDSSFVDPNNPTGAEIQSVISAITVAGDAAVSTILDVANNTQPSTVLNEGTFAAAGIEGVDSSNLAYVTSQIDSGAYTTYDDINNMVANYVNYQAVTDALSPTGDPSTIDATGLNSIDGVSGAVDSAETNALYGEALASAADSGEFLDPNNPTVTEINTVIAAVNTIAAVSTGTQPTSALTTTDLEDAGITGATTASITGIADQLATNTLTSITEIQNMVTGYVSVVDDMNGNTNGTAITATELNAIAGVTGAEATNEVFYSDALNNAIFVDSNNPTPAEIQTVVNAVNIITDTITNGGNAASTLEQGDLELVGITGLNGNNIDDVVEQIATGELTTIAAIQSAVNGFNAIIEDIDGNNDGTLVTAVQINALAGISDAIDSNQGLYVEALSSLDSQTLTNQQISDAVSAVNDLADIIANGANATATLEQNELETMGVIGLDTVNTPQIVNQIATGELTTIAAIQSAVNGFNAIIEDIDGNNDGTLVTAVQINALAGISDAIDSNQGLYVEALSSLDSQTLTNQQISDAVSAVNDLADIIANGTNATATLEQNELETMGVIGLDTVNTPQIVNQIATGELTTIADIQDVLDGLNAIIDDINGNEDGQLVTAEEINRLVDIDNATESNQDLYSEAFSRLDSEALTTQDITAAVSAVNDLADMFINGTDATATLEQSELEAVGISGLDDSSTERVIDKINSGELTSLESIQDYVTAYNTINDYLDDPTKTPPSSLDYETVGIMAVSDTNLSEINQGLKDKLVVEFDDIQALVDTVNIPSLENDMDGDGIIDDWDKDMDGDGVANHLDAFPADKFASVDFNGDGVPDAGIQPLRSVNVGKNDSVIVNSGEVLEFVPVTLTTGASLEDVSSRFGKVAIIDNKILFQAPEKVPEQLYINYQWKDINGDVFDELLKMTSGSTNVDAPVFGNLGPKEIDAEGLFTKIDALTPTAFDILGNPVPVSIDGTPRIRSGNQVVYWVAKDDQGRESIAGQLFKVNPQVNIEQNRIAYEGEKSTLTIRLNGLAPDYPVNIPLSIAQGSSSSDSSDHGLSPIMILSIEKDRTALVEFDVYADDVIEGKETLVVNLDPSVNKGVYDSVQIDINEGTPIPVIEANVIDREGQIVTLAYPELAEGLSVSADIVSFATDIEFEWYYRRFGGDAEFIGNTLNNNSLALGKALSIGRHEFEFIGTAVNEEIPPILGKALLRVIEPKELSFDIDSDRDGISDKDEGFVDSDGDLIPDYLDSVDVCELQVIDNDKAAMNGGYVLESTPGSCMKLGLVSESVGSYSPFVNVSNLGEDLNDIFKLPADEENLDAYVVSEVHNYTVTNVLNESVTVVLPLTSPFTDKSVLRKYTDREGWFDFDTTESGSGLRYAVGEPGFCPSPGAEDYVDTFVEDAYCLEVTLKDGGRHDNDGVRNGQIDDPSYVLEKANAVRVNVRGGSSDTILMYVLLLLVTVRYLSTKKETLHRHTFSK